MRLKEALEGVLLCAVLVVDCTVLAEGGFQTSPAKCVFKGRDSKTRAARFLPGLAVVGAGWCRAGGHSVRMLSAGFSSCLMCRAAHSTQYCSPVPRLELFSQHGGM